MIQKIGLQVVAKVLWPTIQNTSHSLRNFVRRSWKSLTTGTSFGLNIEKRGIQTTRGYQKSRGHHAVCTVRSRKNLVFRRRLATKTEFPAGSMNLLPMQLSTSSHTRTASFRKTS